MVRFYSCLQFTWKCWNTVITGIIYYLAKQTRLSSFPKNLTVLFGTPLLVTFMVFRLNRSKCPGVRGAHNKTWMVSDQDCTPYTFLFSHCFGVFLCMWYCAMLHMPRANMAYAKACVCDRLLFCSSQVFVGIREHS